MVFKQKQNFYPANFMIYVYLLKSSKDGNYYVGITKNIKERLKKHNSCEVMSTKNRCPWKLMYSKMYSNYSDARKHEKWLKKKNHEY
ncbi:MAG: GIY-YIG nuclease family protein, partial [Thermoplasmatales archaeon]|nr:GIY-YIG nuclease family protein [Thermoplasmatales archaeon]